MGLFKKIDEKIKCFLENQIEKQDNKSNSPINLKISENPNKAVDLGLYFMDIYLEHKNKKNKTDLDYDLMDYYWIVGCATQGRIDEVQLAINEINDEKSKLKSILIAQQDRLIKIGKIAEIEENKKVGRDLRINETLGQYTSRKLSQNEIFMNEFYFFKSLDVKKLLQ